MERSMWQGSEGGSQWIAREKLSLTTYKELNPVNTHVSLEADFLPIEPSHETAALSDNTIAAL